MRNRKLLAATGLIMIVAVAACSTAKHNTSYQTQTYTPVSKELYDSIVYMDSVLFEGSAPVQTATVQVVNVPEPSSLAFMGTGLVGLMGVIRRKYRKQSVA